MKIKAGTLVNTSNGRGVLLEDWSRSSNQPALVVTVVKPSMRTRIIKEDYIYLYDKTVSMSLEVFNLLTTFLVNYRRTGNPPEITTSESLLDRFANLEF